MPDPTPETTEPVDEQPTAPPNLQVFPSSVATQFWVKAITGGGPDGITVAGIQLETYTPVGRHVVFMDLQYALQLANELYEEVKRARALVPLVKATPAPGGGVILG